ncbi:FHA domain-containing protein [Marinobacter fonticola]|uniref:FHA domain-containing protein n=1 Tax=Marinobacter fonticola TaxID=2603215 RepID=UPI0011E656C3|nr:FHA domain-containing protein [Marinobacter fonticola]
MAALSQLVDNLVVTTFELDGPRVLIGRHPENDIQIDEISVSSRHAYIDVESNAYLEGTIDHFVTDNNSTNGTFVNDIRLTERQRLNNNDIVRVGWNLFRFVDEDENALEKTAFILEE